MILKQNTSIHIMSPSDANDVLPKSYTDIMTLIIASQTFICAFLVIFLLSYLLQIPINSSRVVAQNCRTYIQNIIDYILKVNYIANNIST